MDAKDLEYKDCILHLAKEAIAVNDFDRAVDLLSRIGNNAVPDALILEIKGIQAKIGTVKSIIRLRKFTTEAAIIREKLNG